MFNKRDNTYSIRINIIVKYKNNSITVSYLDVGLRWLQIIIHECISFKAKSCFIVYETNTLMFGELPVWQIQLILDILFSYLLCATMVNLTTLTNLITQTLNDLTTLRSDKLQISDNCSTNTNTLSRIHIALNSTIVNNSS